MQRPSGECVSCWRNSVKKIFREIQVFQQNVRRVWNKFQEFLFGYAVRSIDNINISCGRFVVFWKWVYFKILICSNNLFNNILLQRPSRSFAFFLPVCIFERYNFFRHQRFSNIFSAPDCSNVRFCLLVFLLVAQCHRVSWWPEYLNGFRKMESMVNFRSDSSFIFVDHPVKSEVGSGQTNSLFVDFFDIFGRERVLENKH